MKGHVIETTATKVYLCIGSKDGANVGQELDVYRVAVIPDPSNVSPRTFKRELTGKVRITAVVDEHFAEAVIVSGSAQVPSLVELINP
ncbi:MAG: hypothetical protein C0392_09110 [Syntrophus sp. (in: bacteria)]|nr:hypothetical protein [Syntrophus sp. (in: bacteria)]